MGNSHLWMGGYHNTMKWELTRKGPGSAIGKAVISVLALALIVVLLYRQVRRWQGPSLTVWVAAEDLTPGTLLEPRHLAQTRARERDLPPGAAQVESAIAGLRLVREKAAGTPFVREDFASPGPGPGLAEMLPEGRVLVFLSLPGLPVDRVAQELRFGDRFDVVAVARRGPAAVYSGPATPVVHDAFFVGWVAQRRPENGERDSAGGGLLSDLVASTTPSQPSPVSTPLLLAVYPDDAVSLTEARAAGALLSLVLHGRKEVDKGELLTLPTRLPPRRTEVELITGPARQRIPTKPFEPQ